MRRLLLPGIPFALSMALSLSTAGSHAYWQDSGFFLVAVKELGILYPPGFALYVLLCKAWTLALSFVDFTYAVHLFSAVCAAGAAGTIAVAARDLLRTKGPLFRTVETDSPSAAVGVGCLAAAGYTFWAAAILAKVYAFYFLILSLLIWRMIRADEDRKPRDFTIVAVLIGVAWQAHPSATLPGAALLLFVVFHRNAVGGKGMAWRTAIAALCAIGPIHLLPLFKHSHSALQFGDPGTWAGFWEYVTGTRFTSLKGAWGLESSRAASAGRFFWEEFLGIGALLVLLGFRRLWLVNRRLLIGLAAWIVPVIVITVLFKLEGQHDFWMVAAWIPLWLVAAVGLTLVGRLREAAPALALAGVLWAVIANRPDLDQRNYTLAETFGRALLDPLPTFSALNLGSDDAQSTVLYLQRVRNVRCDVAVVNEGVIAAPFSSRTGPPYFYERPEMPTSTGPVRLDQSWGPLWTAPLGPENPGSWKAPIDAEQVPPLFRRARGQYLDPGRTVARPEPYEKRLLRMLLLARKNQADQKAREGNLPPAMQLYESILALDPWMHEEPTVVLPLATIYVGLAQYPKAEATFRKALALELEPAKRAEAYYFLAALCGDRPEAAEWRAKALASPDLPPPLRAKLEGR